MEFIQNILDSGAAPVVTAFLLGILTALSPCPLATNIAAIGYIGKNIGEDRRKIFGAGLSYTLGRVISYTVLGIVLIVILKGGSSIFGIQKFIGKYGEMLIGPVLVLAGVLMLFADKLKIGSFGYKGDGGKLGSKGIWGALLLGILFALAFCPTSAVFYFGMLIPMSATATAGYLLPVLFAIATALPVVIVAWILAFSAQKIGTVYGKMKTIQKWLGIIVGVLFIAIGIYYIITIYF